MDLKEIFSKMGVNISDEIFDDFINYTYKKHWDDYNMHIMDLETIVRNKIDALNLVFPNGTVEKEYGIKINIPYDEVVDFWFDSLDAIGLQCTTNDDNSCTIKGTPIAAGDFPVVMRYTYKGWVQGRDIPSKTFHLIINPDPKSLWKNIPTDTTIDYFKEDSETGYLQVDAINDIPQKDIVAASMRGRSHAHEGKPRDDHFRLHFCDASKWYVMAVADGAGSAIYSREGSRIACDTAVGHCINELIDAEAFEEAIKLYWHSSSPETQKKVGDRIYSIVGNAAFKAHRAINAEAAAKNARAKDYATTLLLSICKRFEFGWFVASFWVGDGAMAIYDKERQYLKLLGTPDGGEYAGQTRFLTMPEIFSDATAFYGRLKFSIEDDFTALIIMSDGVSDPMFETDANLNKIEKWNELWENINQEVDLKDDNAASKDQLLEWLNFWSAGNHDDRTIAILY